MKATGNLPKKANTQLKKKTKKCVYVCMIESV